ncbi:hypothetical protein EI555_008558 [Monodon monoceros]|uniref:Uncharacterized protein n=1 Tax=Monodon monoceros TaxID=40151 RepID=A0A4U1FM62_MONMO|nr:hypothetical protein EI555_008558 [Monodon monoceros]
MSWNALLPTPRLDPAAYTQSIVVHARQGSLMLSTMHPTTNWSVPRPW